MMDRITERTAGNAPAPTRGYLVDKAIVLGPGAAGTIAMVYLAWYRLPILLWSWANEAWWHWPVAVLLGLAPLTIAPPLALIGTIAVVRATPRTRRLFWWAATAFLAALALGLLLFWAFLPGESWWRTGYWWIWMMLVIALSVLAAGSQMFTVVQPVTTRKKRDTFEREWRFNHGDLHSRHSPPALGLAMSGGGIRSAAFNLGVLWALNESGILQRVDVMSAVSGGTYIMSWYLLQPFYEAKAQGGDSGGFGVSDVIDEMFDPDGRFQHYLLTRPELVNPVAIGIDGVMGATLGEPLRALMAFDDDLRAYNSNGALKEDYRNSIQRLFHGHPRRDAPDAIDNSIKFTWKSDDDDDFGVVTPVRYAELAKFAEEHRLPFFIFNCAMLVDRACRQMIWPTAFELTADDFGSDVCGYRSWDDLAASAAEELRVLHSMRGRWRLPWTWRSDPDEEMIERPRWVERVNLAPAISGAAIGLARFDPTKPERSMKLATWTPFVANFDLGYLLPRKLLNSGNVTYVSDGGHAENLGGYALIRRGCRTIIVVDAEHEAALPYVFEGYRKLRDRLMEEESLILRVDMIESYLDGHSAAPSPAVMTGTVRPAGKADPGWRELSIVYIKLGLDRSALDRFPAEVQAYAAKNERFPQDPTTDQAFTPDQFRAYRALGHHVGSMAAAGPREAGQGLPNQQPLREVIR